MLRVKPLAEQIREAREDAHLSQVELARELGVSPRTVQNWESGKTPQPRHRRAIASFLSANGEAAA
jgi:DNA-binding transcriptional regulator YiaG